MTHKSKAARRTVQAANNISGEVESGYMTTSQVRGSAVSNQCGSMYRILAAMSIALLLASPALAQTTRRPALPQLPDPLHLNQQQAQPAPVTGTNGGFAAIGQQLQKLTKDIIDKAISDVTAANADATIRQDVIAQPCYAAQLQFLQLLPIEWVASPGNPTATPPVPATPGPPAEIGPVLGFQVARDLMNAITGNDKGSLKVACAALLGDQLSILNQTLGMFGIAALAGLPVGL